MALGVKVLNFSCRNILAHFYVSTLNVAHSTPTTVRYGTRLATAEILYDNDSDHNNISPSVMIKDTCPNDTVQCNGIKDCQLGTDETNCSE